ncbi:hypothetical protein WA588_000633 [Blastocystis sp. NMH]
MTEAKAVLFTTTNQATLSKEQDLKSVYEYYSQFPLENRFAEIEKAKGGTDPAKTVIFKSTVYIILTNKENVTDIINRCIAANYSSVAYDAITKCIGYYRELGPDSRVAMMQSFSMIYTLSFPYLGRMTSQLLSLSQCCYVSQSNMWLTQRILDCLEPNIAVIIATARSQKEQATVPTLVLWCLRKCYDHVFIAPPFAEREASLIQKIFTLDRDSFQRCGVDALFYLSLLRPYVLSLKSLYQTLLQDGPYCQLLLVTCPSLENYAFSSDSEIRHNIDTFYSSLRDARRIESSGVQTRLRNLLLFKNTNMIWNSAVVTVLRLCLLQYPSEGVTDTVIDYCIQFVRFISMPASASNQRVQNKEVLDGLFMLLLFQLQTPAKDIINDYITQTSSLKSDHGNNVIDFVRMGLRLAVSTQGNAFVASIFTFFKQSFTQAPSHHWWESNLAQLPLDLQNLLKQLTTMTPSSLLTSESKRVRIDRGNDETLGMEERQMLGILEKYSKSEMRLFLLSLRGRKEVGVFGMVLGVYYDSQESCAFIDPLSQCIIDFVKEEDAIVKDLLVQCRPNCRVLDFLVMERLVRGEIERFAKEAKVEIPAVSRKTELFAVERLLYDYLSYESDAHAVDVSKHILELFSKEPKELNDIIEGILKTSALLDILCKEEDNSPIMEMLLFIIPFFLKYLRKQIHTIPIIKFLCMNMQISFSPFPRKSFISTRRFFPSTRRFSKIPSSR